MFNKYFEVFLADTKKSKKIHYSIRYQVYCEEMGFENKEDFPLQMEYDENDRTSTHFIVRDKRTGLWVGAMRLIFKNDDFLPIERSCTLDEKIAHNELFGAVELSRLCLIKDARRGIKDIDHNGAVDDSNTAINIDNIASIPHRNKFNRLIIWGLIHAASDFCSTNNIHHWYFMTTSILARVLRRGGLDLMGIGDPCSHKGERFPFKMNVIETYQSKIWEDYEHGYQLFSQWNSSQIPSLAAVA